MERTIFNDQHRTFLISKEKLKYIQEDAPAATSSECVKEDDQVRLWLWNLMEPHISCNAMLLPIAYAVWTSISESWASTTNIQRIYGLYEVFLTKQGTKNIGGGTLPLPTLSYQH